MRLRNALLLLTLPLLAGCELDSAAYMIDGNSDHALTLVRDVKYWWSDKAELALVVAHFPECQRRHEMKPQPVGSSKVALYSIGDGRFLLQQGKNWYLADNGTCALQTVDAPKEGEAGTLLGNWQKRDRKFDFVPASDKASVKPAG